MPVANPIAQVYTGIWSLLEANSGFTALVLPGNRIKYIGGNRAAGKEIVNTADTPMVSVMPLGMRPHLDASSSSSELVTIWSIEVLPGTVKIETLSDLDWEIYRAMSEWRTLRTTVSWGSETPVKRLYPVNVDPEINERRYQRVPKGWTSLWVGHCHLWFSRGIVNLDVEE